MAKYPYSGLLFLPPSHYEADEIVDEELDSGALGKEMGCFPVSISKLIGRTFSKGLLGCGKEMLAASGIHLVVDSYRRACFEFSRLVDKWNEVMILGGDGYNRAVLRSGVN